VVHAKRYDQLERFRRETLQVSHPPLSHSSLSLVRTKHRRDPAAGPLHHRAGSVCRVNIEAVFGKYHRIATPRAADVENSYTRRMIE
jgi:hypothetical protein